MSEFGAVKQRLLLRFPGKVEDTVKTDSNGDYVRDNYLILFGGRPSELGGDRQAFRQVADDNAVYDITVRAVAVDADTCRRLLRDASFELVAWKPTVPGRDCTIRFTGGSDPRPDHAARPPLFYADDEYELRSLFTSRS